MSIQTTTPTDVALFDGVTGLAFGPVFESEEHAQDFIDWCVDNGHAQSPAALRHLRPLTLKTLREVWFDRRVDGATGLLIEEVPA